MYEPSYSPSYGLNSSTTIQGWLWCKTTHNGWHDIKQRKETKLKNYLIKKIFFFVSHVISSNIQLDSWMKLSIISRPVSSSFTLCLYLLLCLIRWDIHHLFIIYLNIIETWISFSCEKGIRNAHIFATVTSLVFLFSFISS